MDLMKNHVDTADQVRQMWPAWATPLGLSHEAVASARKAARELLSSLPGRTRLQAVGDVP